MGPRAHIMFSNEVAAPKRLGTTEIEEAKASEFRFQLFTFFRETSVIFTNMYKQALHKNCNMRNQKVEQLTRLCTKAFSTNSVTFPDNVVIKVQTAVNNKCFNNYFLTLVNKHQVQWNQGQYGNCFNRQTFRRLSTNSGLPVFCKNCLPGRNVSFLKLSYSIKS